MLPKALNILDRFHIVKKLNEAVDQVRRNEAKRLHQEGYEPILKRSRYSFLKRPCNLTPKQSEKLTEVLQYDLKTTRASFLKEAFDVLKIALFHQLGDLPEPTFTHRFC